MRASTASRAVSIRIGTAAAGLPNRATDGKAVLDRQHHVEDHGVVVGRADLEHGRLAVAGDVHGIRLLTQSLGQHLRGVRLVFDQQDAHGDSLHRLEFITGSCWDHYTAGSVHAAEEGS